MTEKGLPCGDTTTPAAPFRSAEWTKGERPAKVKARFSQVRSVRFEAFTQPVVVIPRSPRGHNPSSFRIPRMIWRTPEEMSSVALVPPLVEERRMRQLRPSGPQ
jgi:hypothetical protein